MKVEIRCKNPGDSISRNDRYHSEFIDLVKRASEIKKDW